MMFFLSFDIKLRVGLLALAQGQHAIATLPGEMDGNPLLIQIVRRGSFEMLTRSDTEMCGGMATTIWM